MNEGQQKAFEVLGAALLNHIEPLLVKGAKLTLLVRYDKEPDSDVLISSDTVEGIDEIIARSKERQELNK